MIRAGNHSSYPRVADSPLEQQLRHVLKRAERGKATPDQIQEVEDAVTSMLVADQSRAFVDVVTDGMARWSGPHSHLARFLNGVETGGMRRWFDTNFYDRRLRIVGEISRPAPMFVRDYRIAEDTAQKPLKPVLPGPVTISRLAQDEIYGSPDKLAEELAAVLAEEVADLAAAGATHFQIDEPLLCHHPEDLELVQSTAGKIFAAAGEGATTILSTYYGDLTALGEKLDEIPGTHLGLDLVRGPANYALLDRLPEGRGVVLGMFDANTTVQEDARDAISKIEPHHASLIKRDVIVGPNAGLELLPRDQAFDKLLHSRYVAEMLSEGWPWES